MEELLKQINEEYSECSNDQGTIETTFDKLIKEKRADLFCTESDLKKRAEKQKKRLRSCASMIESVEKKGTADSSSFSDEALAKDLQEKKIKIKQYVKKLDVINKQTLNTGGKLVELFLGKENSSVLVGDDCKKFNFKKEYESFK